MDSGSLILLAMGIVGSILLIALGRNKPPALEADVQIKAANENDANILVEYLDDNGYRPAWGEGSTTIYVIVVGDTDADLTHAAEELEDDLTPELLPISKLPTIGEMHNTRRFSGYQSDL